MLGYQSCQRAHQRAQRAPHRELNHVDFPGLVMHEQATDNRDAVVNVLERGGRDDYACIHQERRNEDTRPALDDPIR
jgi:hypothetical protein